MFRKGTILEIKSVDDHPYYTTRFPGWIGMQVRVVSDTGGLFISVTPLTDRPDGMGKLGFGMNRQWVESELPTLETWDIE